MSVMGEEYDDDAYYLELRRRILLLMADDEEENFELDRNYGQSWNRCDTGFPVAMHPLGKTCLEDGLVCGRNRWESEKARRYEAPSWMVNLWRNGNGSSPGNGTGVFIPQVVKPMRRQKPGRKMKSSGRRMPQQV